MSSKGRCPSEKNGSSSNGDANLEDSAQPSSSAKTPRYIENMVAINALNAYISCPLCNGYFVDATTVIDCLHTFCKSCLLKYFQENIDCPKCHNQIHQSHPSHYVAFDRTMQDLVYKLVPGMQSDEQRRREQFKQRQKAKEARELDGQETTSTNNGRAGSSSSSGAALEDSGISNSSIEDDAIGNVTKADEENGKWGSSGGRGGCCVIGQDPTIAHRRNDELVLIHLVPDDKLKPIDRSFVRLSAFATVNTGCFNGFPFIMDGFEEKQIKENHNVCRDIVIFLCLLYNKNTVKRLLAYLVFDDITKYNEFDIFCNRELMGRDFSMAFITKTRWRNRAEPVILMYKAHLDF